MAWPVRMRPEFGEGEAPAEPLSRKAARQEPRPPSLAQHLATPACAAPGGALPFGSWLLHYCTPLGGERQFESSSRRIETWLIHYRRRSGFGRTSSGGRATGRARSRSRRK